LKRRVPSAWPRFVVEGPEGFGVGGGWAGCVGGLFDRKVAAWRWEPGKCGDAMVG